METMGLMGFIFGLSGLSFGLMAWQQIAGLKKEFEDLKKDLVGDSGVLKKQAGPEDK